MTPEDGPYFSPDGGNFWVKQNVIYWEDGYIWENADQRIIRTMPLPSGEDYSAWSEEKRALVKAEWDVKRAEYKAQKEIWQKEQDAFVASAKAKLTEDEFESVLNEGRRDS